MKFILNLLIVLFFFKLNQGNNISTFQQFLKAHPRKNYTTAEKQKRALIYQKRYQFLNNYKNQSAKYKVNRFADWTDQQLRAFTNTKFNQSLPSIKFVSNSQLKVGAVESLDWRTGNLVSSIKDQGLCGDCWAFASVAMAETALLNSTKIEYDLSQQFILECTSSGTCSGGYINDGISTIINYKGIPNQTTYNYNATKPYYGTGICNSNSVVKVPVTAQKYYYNLTNQNVRQILSYGPVAVAIQVQTKFFYYSDGVYSCQSTNFSQLNHAVQLIGYDSSGNWIIKNQWGTSWGINGFGVLDSVNSCGIGWATYQLGIQRLIISYILGLMIILLVI